MSLLIFYMFLGIPFSVKALNIEAHYLLNMDLN